MTTMAEPATSSFQFDAFHDLLPALAGSRDTRTRRLRAESHDMVAANGD